MQVGGVQETSLQMLVQVCAVGHETHRLARRPCMHATSEGQLQQVLLLTKRAMKPVGEGLTHGLH